MTDPAIGPEGGNRGIVAVARRLPAIARLGLRSRSGPGSRCGWSGHGEAVVRVERDEDGSLVFHETGRFVPAHGGAPLGLRNVLRWSVDADRIVLAHRRFGTAAEVRLVELVAVGPGATAGLVCREPHRCGDDRYFARLRLSGDGFVLLWRITGPGKDETLRHAYRSARASRRPIVP